MAEHAAEDAAQDRLGIQLRIRSGYAQNTAKDTAEDKTQETAHTSTVARTIHGVASNQLSRLGERNIWYGFKAIKPAPRPTYLV